MAISRVSSASAESTSITSMPTHASGDLLVMFAFRDGSTTAPSLPAGWTNLASTGANTCSARIAYKTAASGSETSGTWTNANELICAVYRGQSSLNPVRGASASTGSSTTVTYNTVTMYNGAGTSWVAGFAGHRSTDTTVGTTAPSGMTNFQDLEGATADAGGFDTNGGVSSWSSTNASVGGTTSGWVSYTVEIVPSSADYLVQTKTATPSASSSQNVTWSNNTTSGNTIVVAITVNAGSTNSVSSITDSQGNSYSRLISTLDGSAFTDFELWYAANITGGTTPTITVSVPSADRIAFIAREYTGLTSSPSDKSASSSGSSTSLSSGNTATISQASEILIGAGGTAADDTFTVGSGFGNLTSLSSSLSLSVATEDRIVNSTAAYSATMSVAATTDWAMGIATFKLSSGFAPNVSDTVTTTESVNVALAHQINKSDSTTLTESVGRTLVDNVSVSDSTSLTESVSVALPNALAISVSDSTSLTDTPAVLLECLVSRTEAVGTTESVTMMEESYLSVSDSLTASESLVVNLQSDVRVSDSTSLTEANTTDVQITPSLSDSTSVTESRNVLLVSDVNVSDSVTTTENTSVVNPTCYVNVSDTVNSLDNPIVSTSNAFFIYASEAVGTSENVSLAQDLTVYVQPGIQDIGGVRIV